MLHRIRKHIRRYHRVRKRKERNLPDWKRSWCSFNERRLAWLEIGVEKLLPWLVLLLLMIILGEFSKELNIFSWNWMDNVAGFFSSNESKIKVVDRTIVAMFATDLYFNFFKKRTVWSFIKASFLDILAIAPLGMIFRVSEAWEGQAILHVGSEVEREGAALKIARTSRAAKLLVRLHRLSYFFDGNHRLPRKAKRSGKASLRRKKEKI